MVNFNSLISKIQYNPIDIEKFHVKITLNRDYPIDIIVRILCSI